MLLLGGCAEVERREPAPPPVASPKAEPKIESQPLKYLTGRKFAPMPERPLTVRSRCAYRNPDGTRTQLDLLVKNAEVKTFSAEVTIPRRGTCRFNMKTLAQQEKLPQVKLAANDGCTVRMWEEPQKRGGSRVTIAFNACPAACEGNTFDYLWPIMVDAKTGRCF